MSSKALVWDVEKHRLMKVQHHLEQQLKEIGSITHNNREEVKTARKWMWEDLSRDVAKFENALDLVQHGLDLHRKERIYLFSDSLVKKLQKMLPSPYFGRIDFTEKGKEEQEQIYIGISTLTDSETGEILIYDWRAPVSSMFYDYQLGHAEYGCHDGIVQGDIVLKRQFKIMNGKLEYMFDSSIQIGDEVLQEMLSKNADDRMKSIVTTIQREQNQVIREERHKVLIVQGSAGSGKTSIALQRVAYLLYKHRETMNANNVLIFSPNDIFNDYISDVLPELGEENMHQTTFQDYTDAALGSLLSVEDKYDQLEYLLSYRNDSYYEIRKKSIQYKASADYVQVIKNYINYLDNEGMRFKDITYQTKMVISKEELAALYYEQYKMMSINNRLEEIERKINASVKLFAKEMVKRIQEKLFSNPNYIGTDEEIHKLSKQIVKKRLRKLHEQVKTWLSDHVFEHYCLLFQEDHMYRLVSSGSNPDDWDHIRLYSLTYLEKGEVYYEDVAPLLYLKGAFEGITNVNSIRHAIIDEAQDYSAFHYELIQKHFPRSRLTLLGDLNQSINPYMNIHSYESIVHSFDEKEAAIIRLSKSYRSTQEIVRFSKSLLIDGEAIDFLDRSGDKPQLVMVSEVSLVKGVTQCIKQLEKQGIKSIAVICKTARESQAAYELLKDSLEIYLVTKKERTFKRGIVVIPTYLSKGLEFDSVIIYNGSDEHYAHESERKLFYTACTRALHKLYIFFSGKPCTFIRSLNEELYDLVEVGEK